MRAEQQPRGKKGRKVFWMEQRMKQEERAESTEIGQTLHRDAEKSETMVALCGKVECKG